MSLQRHGHVGGRKRAASAQRAHGCSTAHRSEYSTCPGGVIQRGNGSGFRINGAEAYGTRNLRITYREIFFGLIFYDVDLLRLEKYHVMVRCILSCFMQAAYAGALDGLGQLLLRMVYCWPSRANGVLIWESSA